LSGGQQQRVALARAIVGNPSVLLFDEPLSNLDAQLRQRLRDDLRRLHEQARRTALYVTHDQSEALVLADRIAVMNRGIVEQLGSAEDIFRRPATRFVAEFVGFENFIPGEIVIGGKHPAVRIPDWGAEFQIPSHLDWTHGDRVLVACRPSALTADAETREPASISGTVVNAAYMGETYLCTVRIGQALVRATSRVKLTGDARHAGRPIQLRVSAQDLILVDDRGSSSAAQSSA
jgi:iron(III) transport system ATP-binding protein